SRPVSRPYSVRSSTSDASTPAARANSSTVKDAPVGGGVSLVDARPPCRRGGVGSSPAASGGDVAAEGGWEAALGSSTGGGGTAGFPDRGGSPRRRARRGGRLLPSRCLRGAARLGGRGRLCRGLDHTAVLSGDRGDELTVGRTRRVLVEERRLARPLLRLAEH